MMDRKDSFETEYDFLTYFYFIDALHLLTLDYAGKNSLPVKN